MAAELFAGLGISLPSDEAESQESEEDDSEIEDVDIQAGVAFSERKPGRAVEVQNLQNGSAREEEEPFPRDTEFEETEDEKLRRLQARPYQEELLQKAIKGNTIVYLGTGSGKTFIAVMLIKEMRGELDEAKKAIFLVSSVALVAQQRKLVEEQTGLQVKTKNLEKIFNIRLLGWILLWGRWC